MEKPIIKVAVDKLRQHPYHRYTVNPSDALKVSFLRTGKRPVYPIVVVPGSEPGMYWVIAGMNRLETLILMGVTEVEVILLEITDENEIKNLIVDLNKQRIKNGKELLMEFRHFLSLYPEQRGQKGNDRYSSIGKELNLSRDRVKDYVMMNNFFEGEGDIILENYLEGSLSHQELEVIKKVVEKHPDKFKDEKSFEKVCNPKFKYDRLAFAMSYLSLDDDDEYSLLLSYLLGEITPQEFHKRLEQLGKVKQLVKDHENDKVFTPILDDKYTTENAHLICGNNREVVFRSPFENKVKVIIGSPPYGNRRLNGNDPSYETGHNMTGKEYGIYLAETYEGYKYYLAPDGSIYVIIDDYRLVSGAFACSLEHFVVEMENRGFFLVGRYPWIKTNPMPRSYADKDMVNGFEMVYRFSLDPKNYYCNPSLFIERENVKGEGFIEGCINTDGKGNTTKGTTYFQSNLKKLRNTLDEKSCTNIINGNVANPRDYFRQAGEKKHTSTSPIYLTSVLILESTQPGDLVLDIWNGVGNTMDSALLLGRKYVGIELENDYFQQSCRRADDTERILKLNTNEDLSQAA